MDTYTDSELDTFGLLQSFIQVFHRSEDTQTSPYCSLGIIFMCLGVAKVDEQTVAQQLCDMPIVALNNFRTHLLIRPYHVTPVFRVELGGKFCGVHEITEHDSELPSFCFWGMRCWWRGYLCREVVLRDCRLHWWWRG